MALYRTIQISFWTDTKIVDDFTPEDKYFYLYLFTNPHTNLSGCYEISKNQMSIELGYTKEVVDRLIDRFKNIHKVIDYDNNTKEIILLNWHKYNWTKSADYKKGLKKEIDKIKNPFFKEYLLKILDGGGTVCTPSLDGGGTSNTNTITNTITITNTNNKENQTEKAQKIIDLFNKNCPSFSKVAKLTEQRTKTINARLKDY